MKGLHSRFGLISVMKNFFFFSFLAALQHMEFLEPGNRSEPASTEAVTVVMPDP